MLHKILSLLTNLILQITRLATQIGTLEITLDNTQFVPEMQIANRPITKLQKKSINSENSPLLKKERVQQILGRGL